MLLLSNDHARQVLVGLFFGDRYRRRSRMRNVQDYTLGDPETATCPYDYYKAMRTQDPVHYDEKIKTFIVSRHEDIMEALADPITFSVEHGFNAQERQDYSGEI